MHPAATKDFWNDKYLENHTPWDLDGPHPYVQELFQLVQKHSATKKLNIYVPGMGKGHDALFFAQQGHSCIGGELAPAAVASAQKIHDADKVKDLDFKLLDAIHDHKPQNLDLIYDRAMLCALPEKVQLDYFTKSISRLKDGGIFASILFSKLNNENGPPWSVDKEKITTMAQSHNCSVVHFERKKVLYDLDFILEEALVLIQKPSR